MQSLRQLTVTLEMIDKTSKEIISKAVKVMKIVGDDDIDNNDTMNDLAKKTGVVMRLGTHLLCKQLPAEGDAAFQRNRGKVGAMAALDFRPRQKRRNDLSKGGA